MQVISQEEEEREDSRKKDRAFRRHAVLGQVPRVVEDNSDKDADDIIIIEDDDYDADIEEPSKLQPQSAAFRCPIQ